jgi:hypothetical protein
LQIEKRIKMKQLLLFALVCLSLLTLSSFNKKKEKKIHLNHRSVLQVISK